MSTAPLTLAPAPTTSSRGARRRSSLRLMAPGAIASVAPAPASPVAAQLAPPAPATAPVAPPPAYPAPPSIRRVDGFSTDHLPAITLAELNAAAGLLTRVDRKYLVPLAVAQDLLGALAGQAHVLQIDGLRRFRYASTYFDTPSLESYYLAARKRRRRFKVRTRTYLDSDLCFLEVKTQGSRETTVKERLDYRSRDASRITRAGRGYVATCLREAGIGDQDDARRTTARLSPVLDSTYERTTLHLPAEEARLTIDTSLAWTARTGRTGHTVHVNGLAVVETKTSAASSPADRLLWARRYRPVGISKYATAMAVLHPELPSHKWHRTLTRELAHATSTCGVTADVTPAA